MPQICQEECRGQPHREVRQGIDSTGPGQWRGSGAEGPGMARQVLVSVQHRALVYQMPCRKLCQEEGLVYD